MQYITPPKRKDTTAHTSYRRENITSSRGRIIWTAVLVGLILGAIAGAVWGFSDYFIKDEGSSEAAAATDDKVVFSTASLNETYPVATPSLEENYPGVEYKEETLTYTYEYGKTYYAEIDTATLPEGIYVKEYVNNGKSDAGSYAVSAVLYDSVTDEYVGSSTAILTINKKVITPTFTDVTVTYDGTAHSIYITDTLPEDINVTYVSNGQTEVGEYTVEAVLGYNANNYQITNNGKLEATLTVEKAYLENVVFDSASVTYNGLAHSIYVDESCIAPVGNYNGTWSYYYYADLIEETHGELWYSAPSWTPEDLGKLENKNLVDCRVSEAINANKYYVIAVLEDDNYYCVKTAVLSVDKAAWSVNCDDMVFGDATVTYNGLAHSILLYTGSETHGIIGDFSIKYYYNGVLANSAINAGVYTVTAVLTSPNYNGEYPVPLDAILTINKAQMEGVVFDGGSFTYNGETHSIYVTDMPADVTVTYSGNEQVNPGTYTVTATLSGSNYDTLMVTATMVINKAKITGITADGSQWILRDPIFTEPHLPEYSGTVNGDTVKFYIDGVETEGVERLGSYPIEIRVSRAGHESLSLFVNFEIRMNPLTVVIGAIAGALIGLIVGLIIFARIRNTEGDSFLHFAPNDWDAQRERNKFSRNNRNKINRLRARLATLRGRNNGANDAIRGLEQDLNELLPVNNDLTQAIAYKREGIVCHSRATVLDNTGSVTFGGFFGKKVGRLYLTSDALEFYDWEFGTNHLNFVIQIKDITKVEVIRHDRIFVCSRTRNQMFTVPAGRARVWQRELTYFKNQEQYYPHYQYGGRFTNYQPMNRPTTPNAAPNAVPNNIDRP